MNIFNSAKKIIPGLLLCIFIAQLGVFLGKFVPSIGGAPLAIFLGLIAGNTFAKSTIFWYRFHSPTNDFNYYFNYVYW